MDSAIVFTGKEEVNSYVLVVLKNAIKLYVNTGMKANHSYTPTAMLAKAGEFTSKVYKRGQLQMALDDLQLMYDDIVAGRVAK